MENKKTEKKKEEEKDAGLEHYYNEVKVRIKKEELSGETSFSVSSVVGRKYMKDLQKRLESENYTVEFEDTGNEALVLINITW